MQTAETDFNTHYKNIYEYVNNYIENGASTWNEHARTFRDVTLEKTVKSSKNLNTLLTETKALSNKLKTSLRSAAEYSIGETFTGWLAWAINAKGSSLKENLDNEIAKIELSLNQQSEPGGSLSTNGESTLLQEPEQNQLTAASQQEQAKAPEHQSLSSQPEQPLSLSSQPEQPLFLSSQPEQQPLEHEMPGDIVDYAIQQTVGTENHLYNVLSELTQSVIPQPGEDGDEHMYAMLPGMEEPVAFQTAQITWLYKQMESREKQLYDQDNQPKLEAETEGNQPKSSKRKPKPNKKGDDDCRIM